MVHVVVMKRFIGLPLLIHIELLWRSRSQNFKSRGVRVGAFVYRLHSPGYKSPPLAHNYTWCDHKVSGPNFFLCDNIACSVVVLEAWWYHHIFIHFDTIFSFGGKKEVKQHLHLMGREVVEWRLFSFETEMCAQRQESERLKAMVKKAISQIPIFRSFLLCFFSRCCKVSLSLQCDLVGQIHNAQLCKCCRL
jgi:hypothetical protein